MRPRLDEQGKRAPTMLSLLSESNIPGIQSLVSRQADVVHDALSRRLSHHRFACRRPGAMDARIYSLELSSIQLVDLSYGVDVDVEAEVGEDHFLVHMGLQGETQMWANGKSFPLRADGLIISNPGAPLRVQMTGDCRHFAVRMPIVMCTDYLTRTLGVPVNRPLEFYAGRDGSRELPIAWRGMMAHICDQLRMAPTMMGHRRVQAQYGQLLTELLLGHYCNSYSEQIALHGNDISPAMSAARATSSTPQGTTRSPSPIWPSGWASRCAACKTVSASSWASRRWNMSAATGWNNCTAR
jgi:hypothetical protein